MFAGSVFHTPGQELREFTVLTPDTRTTANGREIGNGYKEIGKIKGILAEAKPAEIERWRQLQHPITHKIIQQGVFGGKIKAGDVLELNGRRFYLQAQPHNPGGIDRWTIYYCDERSDA